MKRLMMAVLFLCVAGCSFAPTYVQPYQQLPDTWAEVSPADQKKTLERQWWRRFGDETLDALVEKALAHNRDIAQGLARVDSARAALGLARAGQFPQISGQGQGARSQSSREASASYGLERELGLLENRVSRLEGLPASPQPVSGRVGTLWSGTVQAVWELDIWGRWRNAASAAREKRESRSHGTG